MGLAALARIGIIKGNGSAIPLGQTRINRLDINEPF